MGRVVSGTSVKRVVKRQVDSCFTSSLNLSIASCWVRFLIDDALFSIYVVFISIVKMILRLLNFPFKETMLSNRVNDVLRAGVKEYACRFSRCQGCGNLK